MNIHPTALVSEKAELGENVSIGPYAIVEADTQIGDGCEIAAHAMVKSYVTLGKNCKVHAHAVIGGLPQDFGFDGAVTYVKVGDNCTIREGMTINRATGEGTATVVGDNCFLMACAHLAHNCVLGDHVVLANNALLGGHVHVGDRAFIGGGAAIHQFVHLGRMVMVAGVTGLTKDLPPFCTAVMTKPDRIVGLNVVGMRRGGFDPKTRKKIKQTYRTLFSSGLNVSQALEKLEAEEPHPITQEIIDFVRASKRGVCTM